MIVSSTKFRKFASNECQCTRKIVILEIADQDGQSLTIKVASQLTHMSRNLITGKIIKLMKFQVL